MAKLNRYLPDSLQVRRAPAAQAHTPAPPKKQRGPLGSALSVLGAFVSVAGFTASLIVLLMMMLEVTSQGGYCAKGGPYVIVQECSHQATLLTPLSVVGLFVFAGIGIAAKGVGNWIAALAWPALFCTLGGGFIYSIRYPEFGSIGYFLGIMFLLMGGLPLVLAGINLVRRMLEKRANPPQPQAGVVPDGEALPPWVRRVVDVVLFAAGIAGGWYIAQWLLAVA
jgi:hypothetical protein